MFSGSGIKVVTARVSAGVPGSHLASSFAAGSSKTIVLASSFHLSSVLAPLLLSEAAVFAVAAGSGKIPAFLFTVVRALLTF